MEGEKTLWEMEKMPDTGIFSSSHNIFKSLFYLSRKNQGLFVKELTHFRTTKFWTRPNWKHLQTTN